MRKGNNIIKKIFFVITSSGLLFPVTFSQQSSQSAKSVTAIELSCFKKADLTKTIIAVVTAQNNDGKFIPAKNMKINFYSVLNNQQQFIDSANTNNKGQATITLKKDLPLDDSLYFTIVAKIENEDLYENAEEKIQYKDAVLTLNLNPHDTARLATAIVKEMGKNGKEIPVKDAEVKFYVLRMFGIMPASEENLITTNENGEALFAYPKNIPGNAAGLITIAARIEDNKKFGNVESKASAYWGTHLVFEKDPFPRALWEPHAPLALIITISTLFGGVWVVYFIVFKQLGKIKSENINTVK